MAKSNTEKQSGATTKKILKYLAVFIVVYVIIVLIMGFTVQYEPQTLTTCVFAAVGAEGGFTTIIKVVKEVTKTKKGE